MWLFFFFLLLTLPFVLVRTIRWLAIIQQKEYRLDRLWAFFHSAEGRAELFRFWSKPKDFTRLGMKRPRPTHRVLLVALLSSLVLLLEMGGVLVLSMLQLPSPGYFWAVVLWVVLYLLLPLTVIIGSLPTMILSALITYRTLSQARSKLLQTKPRVIGIGGSYGKTSTKHLLHHFLSQKYTVFVTPKSFNTKLSVAQSIVAGYKKQQIALLEYGAYITGEIAYLTTWFPPEIAVETGFTPQHLSLFGTRENSILAESELIAALPENGVVFCNGQDSGAVEICKTGAQDNHAQIKMYSGSQSLIALENSRLNDKGELQVTWKKKKIQTKLIGLQYLVNLQAAFLVSQEFGLSDSEIIEAAETFQPNSSFIEAMTLKTGAYFINDGGTSNPMGFNAALDLLAALPYPKKVLLTAGMIDLGEESRQIHFRLATKAKELQLTVAHVGIDGHDEFAEVFAEELVTDLDAVQTLIKHTDEQTVILLEGKVPKVLEDQITALVQR